MARRSTRVVRFSAALPWGRLAAGLRKTAPGGALLFAGLLAPAILVPAQPPPTAADAPFIAENLGKAYVPVDGPWAFHPGDDPAYALSDLDDSHWARIRVGRPWEGQGFPSLTGFGWYRRHISLPPPREANAGWQLVLVLPGMEDAAEVFWNGRLVGSYGKLPPDPVWYDQAGAGVTDISPHFPAFVPLGPPQSGVLAIRVWKAPYVYYSFPDEGGLTGTPLLGSALALADRDQAAWYDWLRANLWQLGLAFLCSIVAALALLAWFRHRRQRMLLWLALYTVHPLPLLAVVGFPGLLSFRWSYGLVAPFICIEDVSLWFLLLYLLGLRDSPRLVRWTWWMVAVAVFGNFGDGALQLFNWTIWPHHVFLALDVAMTIPALLTEAWGVVLVIFAFRRRLDAARWFLAIVAMLTDLFQALGNWFSLGVRWTRWTFWAPFQKPLFSIAGNQFDAQSVLNTLLLAAIIYAAWRYQAEQTRRQNQRDEEFRSAQQVQQLLIPQELPSVPGFSIESVYMPAGEVGGDFFQIVPADNGGVLIAIGDVSGKGMPAAMTVSLLVGTFRTLAHYTRNPSEILAAMNQRMLARSKNGFTTCLIVRIDSSGKVTLANAGHLAPYANGHEIAVENGLPLGLAADAVYPETVFSLAQDELLTLLSDGVVEARNPTGELFGFDRAAAISTESAPKIAQTAQAFGQEDDITVLTLTFAPAEVLHA
ncbi:MAG: SpoIIE family protein phosphatase [Terracidiphilus sp.]